MYVECNNYYTLLSKTGLLFFVTSSRKNHEEFGTRGHKKDSEILLFLNTNSVRYHRGYKVNFRVISKPISTFPFKSTGFCTFGSVLGNGMILIGFNRGIYQYIASKDKWVEALSPEMQNHTRSRAQGCSLDQDIYIVCGGDLSNKVELMKEITDNNFEEKSLSHRLNKIASQSDGNEPSCDETPSIFDSVGRNVGTGVFKSILQCRCFCGDSLDHDANYGRQNTSKDLKPQRCSYLESNTINEFRLDGSSCDSTHIIQMFCPTLFPIGWNMRTHKSSVACMVASVP